MGTLVKRNGGKRKRKAERGTTIPTHNMRLGSKAPAHARRRGGSEGVLGLGLPAATIARTTGTLAAAAFFAAFVAFALAFTLPTTADAGSETMGATSDAELADVPDQIEADEGCNHAWVARLETIRHPQETHEVKHPAIYEESLVGHTVCNECGAVIDGMAQGHLKESGHRGYTTQVPVVESTLVSDEWTETVVDKDAWDETVQTGAECAVCGEKRAS